MAKRSSCPRSVRDCLEPPFAVTSSRCFTRNIATTAAPAGGLTRAALACGPARLLHERVKRGGALDGERLARAPGFEPGIVDPKSTALPLGHARMVYDGALGKHTLDAACGDRASLRGARLPHYPNSDTIPYAAPARKTRRTDVKRHQGARRAAKRGFPINDEQRQSTEFSLATCAGGRRPGFRDETEPWRGRDGKPGAYAKGQFAIILARDKHSEREERRSGNEYQDQMVFQP